LKAGLPRVGALRRVCFVGVSGNASPGSWYSAGAGRSDRWWRNWSMPDFWSSTGCDTKRPRRLCSRLLLCAALTSLETAPLSAMRAPIQPQQSRTPLLDETGNMLVVGDHTGCTRSDYFIQGKVECLLEALVRDCLIFVGVFRDHAQKQLVQRVLDALLIEGGHWKPSFALRRGGDHALFASPLAVLTMRWGKCTVQVHSFIRRQLVTWPSTSHFVRLYSTVPPSYDSFQNSSHACC
jgi:hypothetical protein